MDDTFHPDSKGLGMVSSTRSGSFLLRLSQHCFQSCPPETTSQKRFLVPHAQTLLQKGFPWLKYTQASL